MRSDLDVEVQPEGTIPAGGEVQVRVAATADVATECRGVQCEAFWEASRRRPLDGEILLEPGLLKPGTDRGLVVDQRAPGGQMHPGIPLSAEFRFVVPAAGPITYSGKRIEIEWRLRVGLDLAGREDPSQTLTLTVVPRSD